MRKYGCMMLALLLVGMLLCGCAAKKAPEQATEPTPGPAMPEQTAGAVYLYDLYYGYKNMDHLIAQQSRVNAAEGKQIEVALLEALIAGPASGSGVERLIDARTVVRSVSSSKEYLYVVLSREFLEPVGMPEEWQSDAELVKQAAKQRQMAAWSVVNTLTELGRYSRVQILIDVNGDGEGQRPTRAMLGFATDEADSTLMEPLSRNDALIYDAEAVITLALDALADQAHDTVASMVAVQEDPSRPDDNALVTALAGADLALVTWHCVSSQISVDGQTALVVIDYEVQQKNGTQLQRRDVPMRLVRENGVWMLSYASVLQLLEGGTP